MDRFSDVRSLADATEDQVLQLWSGLGYYARARNMHRAARIIVEVHNGTFPTTAHEIETLPGIGRSTAAAIAAFAFGERGAILDGNVKRVLARYYGIEGFPGSKKIETELWALAASLIPRKAKSPGMEAYTQGLMDLGATVCTRSQPACGKCPLASRCVARVTNRVAELPAPRPRKHYPTRQSTWLVLKRDDRVLLERRPSPGIWGGLWAFPEFDGKNVPAYCRTEFGCTLSDHELLPTFAHGFTHFRLEISALVCTVAAKKSRVESPGRVWFGVQEALLAAIPVPVKKVLNLI
jgi:A/G-specific adenine glycosylase